MSNPAAAFILYLLRHFETMRQKCFNLPRLGAGARLQHIAGQVETSLKFVYRISKLHNSSDSLLSVKQTALHDENSLPHVGPTD